MDKERLIGDRQMKEIQLSQGRIAIVDDKNFERLNQFEWWAQMSSSKKTWYAKSKVWVDGKQKTILMHRIIMNAPRGVQVDHVDGDGLHNWEGNMRLCTNQENAFNRKAPHKSNKLGAKGVSLNKGAKKFRAKIQVNGKQTHLGYFSVLDDADLAYRVAEIKYFGEFARDETKRFYQTT